MRQLIINIILFGALGGMLFHVNVLFGSWEYWVIILIAAGIQANSSIDD